MSIILEPIGKGRAVTLDRAVLFFGRHPECDVVLSRSRKVSRKHCCIAQVNNSYVIRDLGSMNGVRVNGHRVDRESPVHIGDKITIGDCSYMVRSQDGSPAPSAPPKPPLAKVPEPPVGLSQNFPVAIPESDAGFEFDDEQSSNGNRSPNETPPDPIRLSTEDNDDDVIILDDEADRDDSGPELEILPE